MRLGAFSCLGCVAPRSGTSTGSLSAAASREFLEPPGHMRLLTRCIAEDRPRFDQQTWLFALSAVRCAGAISDGIIEVGYVDRVNTSQARRLGAIGATVRVVERVNARHPPANKLRMFEMTEHIGFDALVAADCDIAFVGDPSPELPESTIGLRPADHDCMSSAGWQDLFHRLGSPLREVETFPWKAEATTRYPYFNSGFISVPRDLVTPLGNAWHTALERVDAYVTSLDHQPSWAFFTDQIALSVALADTGLPVTILPPILNVPSHLGRAPATRLREAPLAIHYHDHVTGKGYLLPCGVPLLDRAIVMLNAEIASATGGAPPKWLGLRARIAMARSRLRRTRHRAARFVRGR